MTTRPKLLVHERIPQHSLWHLNKKLIFQHRRRVYFMSDIETYDERVRAIRAYNQPILDDFRIWLEQSGLAEKTVKAHVFNIGFFTEYLVYKESVAWETPAQILSK